MYVILQNKSKENFMKKNIMMLLGGLAVVSAIAISKPRINGSCSAKWRSKLSDKLKNRENGRKDFFQVPGTKL